MVIALFGENDFLVKQRKKALIDEYLKKSGSDMGLEQFDATAEPSKLWQSITAQPFLVDKKLVVVNEPSKSTELAEFLLDKVDEVPESTELLIVEGKLDKRKSYYKRLKKLNNAEEYNSLDEQSLIKWLIETASKKGLELNRSQAQRIITMAGKDQWRLFNELEKLAAHESVTDIHIEDLIEKNPQETIFNLLDALAAGNAIRAQEMYQSLRAQQLDPHYVMSMLTWQMDNILLVAYAGERSEREIASEAKINPYVVQKTRQLTRRLNQADLRKALELIVQTDLQLKTSAVEADDVVRLLLLKLAETFS